MRILPKERSNRRVRILLTGFGQFPGAPANPSAAIVNEIWRTARRRLDRCGIDVVAAVLTVDFRKIGEELAKCLAAAEPDAVLHLGLATHRPMLTVETRAKNRLSQLRPDAQKRRSARSIILAGAPEHLTARFPVLRLAAALRRMGVPMSLSNDAGAYVCNATFYHTLSTAVPLAGFIHVPWPRPVNRPLSRHRAGLARPSLATMIAAIGSALILIGMQVHQLRNLHGMP